LKEKNHPPRTRKSLKGNTQKGGGTGVGKEERAVKKKGNPERSIRGPTNQLNSGEGDNSYL